MTLADYEVVLYRQLDGAWVAEVPAIGGCYALMDTREAALEELDRVFQLIADEHADRVRLSPPTQPRSVSSTHRPPKGVPCSR